MSYHIANHVVRLAQSGDEAARRQIIEVFQPPIRVTVARFLRARFPNDVDDYVQDVFVKVFAHLDDFDESRNVRFSTWIYTFVRNHCFDQLKRKRLPIHALTSSVDDDGRGDWIAAGEPPEEQVLRREFATALRQALNDLPAELRGIFRLRELEGLDFAAIARRLRLPLGTVKSKHYRAIDRLRFLLRPFQLAG